MTKLNNEELHRYNRHIIMPEIGVEGQQKLKNSKIMVVGAGGLGSPILLYLAAAGVGHIGIVEFDNIDVSNLQRQILYTNQEIGESKALKAKTRLQALNPLIHIEVFDFELNTDNVLQVFANYDLIIDGSDNFPTRYLVNDACIILNKPWVFGSIFKFEGQISVFNYQGGPSYRCLFPKPPSAEESPNCAQIGVLGALPGIIGSYQAIEAIKVILALGQVLSGVLLVVDTLTMTHHKLQFSKVQENFENVRLTDYQAFCNPSPSFKDEITPLELKEAMDNNRVLVLDVRENWELEICRLPGLHIPLQQIPTRYYEIPKDKTVVVLCHHGMRSSNAIQYLKANHNFLNLVNLKGGIHAFSQQVDDSLSKY